MTTPLLFSLCTLAGALMVGAMSPGPAFLYVVQTSIARSRRDGLAAALGMGVGATVFAVLVLVGLQAVLTEAEWVFAGLRTAGALYLLYLAVGLWRGADRAVAAPVDPRADRASPERIGSAGRHFGRALLTQLSNPKALVVYGSVFAALLPRDLPRAVAVGLPFGVLMIETGWYAVVALALSSTAPRRAYLRSRTVIDRVAAGAMGLLGVRLLLLPARGR